ncbi:hypothetical protein D3C84_797490 [compost metagenome]
MLAGQLAGAVVIHWCDRICLLPWRQAFTAEHVVGRVVNQPSAQGCCFVSHDLTCLTVHTVGQLGLGFGFIDGSVGRSVDDDVGLDLTDRRTQCIEVGQITTQTVNRVTVQSGQLAKRREGTLQLPAHLTVFSQQEDFHALSERSA